MVMLGIALQRKHRPQSKILITSKNRDIGKEVTG